MAETRRISLFPLPSSVFFPATRLPLHIFERRYREMTAHAIETGQWIGMVLLQPGWEADYYGRPAVKPIGCAGKVEKWVAHPDGKYDIVLLGQSRFRILHEVGEAEFREAEVELLDNLNDAPIDKTPGSPFYHIAKRFWEFRDRLPEERQGELELDVQNCRSLGDVVDRMAWLFDLGLEEKQAFLEEQDVNRRIRTLEAVLDFKTRLIHQSARFARKGLDSRLN